MHARRARRWQRLRLLVAPLTIASLLLLSAASWARVDQQVGSIATAMLTERSTGEYVATIEGSTTTAGAAGTTTTSSTPGTTSTSVATTLASLLAAAAVDQPAAGQPSSTTAAGQPSATTTAPRAAATTSPPRSTTTNEPPAPPTTSAPTTAAPAPRVVSSGGGGPALGAFVAPVSVGGIQLLSQFGNDVGRTPTVAMAYVDATTGWDAFANPAWMLNPWADWLRANSSRRLVLAVPMLLTSAAGDFRNPGYDQYFVRLAESIRDRGIGSQVVIRLGYEMNGDWMPWGRQYSGNGDGSGFREMWRRVVPQMKAVYPFLFDWNIVPDTAAAAGAGYGPNFYPGDDVVDVIGIDLYDHWVRGGPDQRWQETVVKLDWTAGFAAAHGKPMSFDEWGLWSTGNASGGGDNPTYITGMLTWARDHHLLWTSYFNSTVGQVDTILQWNPESLAAFQRFMAGG